MDKQGASAQSSMIGYITAIIQAIFYSTMSIFGKLLYATGLDSQQALILRLVFTVVYLGAMLLVWRKYPLFSRQKETYIQAIFFFVSAWTYMLAVEHMNAGLVTVVFYAFPAVVVLLNVIFFHEKMTLHIAIALALSVIGIICISGLLEPEVIQIDPLGMVCALASCLAFAIYSVMIQRTVREDSSFTATFSLSVVALAMALVFFVPEVPGAFVGFDWYRMLLSSGFAIIATIAPIILYMIAVKHIGATKASIISLVETPASLFLAWLILGETLTAWQFVGSACVVAAVVVVTLKPSAQEYS